MNIKTKYQPYQHVWGMHGNKLYEMIIQSVTTFTDAAWILNAKEDQSKAKISMSTHYRVAYITEKERSAQNIDRNFTEDELFPTKQAYIKSL